MGESGRDLDFCLYIVDGWGIRISSLRLKDVDFEEQGFGLPNPPTMRFVRGISSTIKTAYMAVDVLILVKMYLLSK